MSTRSVLLVGAAGIVAASGLGASALGAPEKQEAALPTKITVSASEFKFALLPKTGKKGTIVFTVVNKGKISHDFKIKGKKTARIGAGKRTTLRVTFPAAGRFPYLCTLPSHAPAGMKGVLVVK